jgi:hypothetical protein
MLSDPTVGNSPGKPAMRAIPCCSLRTSAASAGHVTARVLSSWRPIDSHGCAGVRSYDQSTLSGEACARLRIRSLVWRLEALSASRRPVEREAPNWVHRDWVLRAQALASAAQGLACLNERRSHDRQSVSQLGPPRATLGTLRGCDARGMHSAARVRDVFVRLQLCVYKQFLEILHNYEDKQSSIAEVKAPPHSL